MGKGAVLLVLLALACCLDLSGACTTSADCRHEECCVSRNRPIGKRWLTPSGAGMCQPRAKLSGGCLMRDAVYDPTLMYFQCPCVDGLTCKGNGMHDIPLGEMGTCVHA
ncbi:uncharacterized protein LOC143288031 [Babylonia areolata]|uniref:uncharacterized protein LOC143288031 n=1 Tax=Babylonia areolata TaxID=304850 RepID=UPI003FD4983C